MKIPSEIKLLSLDPKIEKYFRRRRIVQIFDRERNKYDKKWKSRTYSVTTSLTSSTKSSRQQWRSISWELCDSNTSSCTKHYLPSIQILKQDVINLFQNQSNWKSSRTCYNFSIAMGSHQSWRDVYWCFWKHLFPQTLKDRAWDWLHFLPIGSIIS